MKVKAIWFLLLSLVLNNIYAQDTVKIYYDKNWKEISNKDIAVFYRKAFEDSNKVWTAHDYFISNKIQMTGTFRSKKLKSRQGNFVYYYENGNISAKGRYLKNKREGIWTYWYENGEKSSKGEFLDSKKEGIWTYWSDKGQKKSEGKYVDDKADGIWNYWHESGEKKAQGKFLNDNKDSVWNYWYTNGQLNCKEIYNKGSLLLATGYYENGSMQYKENFKNNKIQGEYVYWNEEGRIIFKGNYINGKRDGEWIRYFPDSNIKLYYKNGLLEGKQLGGVVRVNGKSP